MKRLVTTFLTVLACGAVYALPVGNPSEASLLCDGLIWEGHCGMDPCDPCLTWSDAFSVRAGFYGDYVFNRHLNVRNNNGGDDNEGPHIENTEIFTNAGYIAANLWDRFDIFSTLGATNLHMASNVSAFAPFGVFTDGERLELQTRTEFSWSVGARGTLWECGCTSLGIEGQYFAVCPKVTRVTVADVFSVYPDDLNLEYREWQVGFGISHRINMFVPYIAVKWSSARASLTTNDSLAVGGGGTVTLVDFENEKSWGYAVGVSLVDCEKAAITVEGRFADEKAVYVNGQIRF
jgi:major outer membrane protein